MPDDRVETEIVPFVFDNQGFEVAAKTHADVTTTCDLTAESGSIVTLMPHTHKRTFAFDVALVREDGSEESIFEDGHFDSESDIQVFEQPVSLEGFTKIRHTCKVDNDLDRPIVYGIGDDEMCTLFGYIYPASAQMLGYVTARSALQPEVQPACVTLPIGQYRR